ncbi:MAG: hypothetical protein OXR68_00095 [Alphaproteobacteria bacterium]|nr:hypothetical protein [Alphaproteobacteria bacterium]MDD9919011.1 hypothetical protein [Alphaproteobacteria bacterium]
MDPATLAALASAGSALGGGGGGGKVKVSQSANNSLTNSIGLSILNNLGGQSSGSEANPAATASQTAEVSDFPLGDRGGVDGFQSTLENSSYSLNEGTAEQPKVVNAGEQDFWPYVVIGGSALVLVLAMLRKRK